MCQISCWAWSYSMKAVENFSLVVSKGGGLALRHPRARVFTLFCMTDTHNVVFLKPLL